MIRPGASILGALWAESGAAYGLEVRDPTQDKRLMSFTMAVPEAQWRGAMDRWLLRRTMAGLLPDEVRLNQRRGYQAGDVIRRIQDYPQEMEAAIAELKACQAADYYLDLDYMQYLYDTLVEHQDVATTDQANTVLLRGLCSGLFLVQSEGGPRRPVHVPARPFSQSLR
jgi:asparagine synthase (glutamine-hydrolysing)